MTYVYTCAECGTFVEHSSRNVELECWTCSSCIPMKRDYRRENAGIAVTTLKREREHTKEEYAAKFLPSNDDFKSAKDPDGKKGMRQWRDQNSPGNGNKKPYWPGEVERTTF